jgi:hypothetical protein
MSYGVIKYISMRIFMEGALAIELPHIYILFFPNPFINHISSPLYYICKSPFIRFQDVASLFGTRAGTKRVELKLGLDFAIPFFYHSFLSLTSFSYSFSSRCETISGPSTPLLMREWTMTHSQSLVHYGKC